jgi:hypothetical protein
MRHETAYWDVINRQGIASTGIEVHESSVLDLLDKQIVHGLVTDPRIPFATLGAILGVSEQTGRGDIRAAGP